MKQSKTLLNITEASQKKDCTRQTIYRLIEAGVINTYEENRKRYVVDDEVFQNIEIKGTNQHLQKIEKIVSNLKATIEDQNETIAILKEKTKELRATTSTHLARIEELEENVTILQLGLETLKSEKETAPKKAKQPKKESKKAEKKKTK